MKVVPLVLVAFFIGSYFAPQSAAELKCGVGLLDLVSGIDVIYVTRNGYAPSGISGATGVVWDWLDYECLFPKADVAATLPTKVPGIYSMPVEDLEQMMIDPSLSDELPDWGPSSLEACILESCSTLICTDCLSPPESERPTPNSDGVIEIYSLYSNVRNRPSGDCNEPSVHRAAEILSAATGATVRSVCAVTVNPNWGWNCDGPNPSVCNFADGICQSLTGWTNGRLQGHQVALGWVENANTIGLDCGSANTAYAAETRYDLGAFPKHTVAIHEVAHLFGADHWPCDDGSGCAWKKHVCRQIHLSHFHIHNYRSVMNYCHMYWGVTDFDSVNLARIRY